MLSIEVLDARHGDCLLVHWQKGQRSMLVDGGPSGTWEAVLRHRLVTLRRPLEAVCVTHVDDDHIGGVLGLLGTNVRAVRDDQTVPPFPVKRLWFNVPDLTGTPLSPGADATTAASYRQGQDLRDKAKLLGLDGNSPFGGPVTQGCRTNLEGLEITVLTPDRSALTRLAAAWEAKVSDDLVTSGAGFTDRSIPNLSSICLHISAHGRTALLTGDARGDAILAGATACGLLGSGRLHVDVLKLPHHASANNVEPLFFRTIQADHYVICADGKRHDHPSLETLHWLVNSRPVNAEYTIHLTNPIPAAVAELTSLKQSRRFTVAVRADPRAMIIL